MFAINTIITFAVSVVLFLSIAWFQKVPILPHRRSEGGGGGALYGYGTDKVKSTAWGIPAICYLIYFYKSVQHNYMYP